MLEFDAGVWSCEVPVGLGVSGIAVVLPCGNKTFTEAFAKKYGADKPINAIGEAAYDAVYLYAAAVEKAGSTESDAVIKALREVEFDAPQGKVNFAANNCLRANSILARGTPDGHWETVENFGQIDPDVPGCSLN